MSKNIVDILTIMGQNLDQRCKVQAGFFAPMNKPYQYEFRKQGTHVALIAISQRKLSKATQCKILDAFLTERREVRLANTTGEIVIYNDVERASLNDPGRVR